MKGSKVAAAKKASPSLASLLEKKEDNKEETSTVENDNNGVDIVEESGSETVDSTEPVDQTVDDGDLEDAAAQKENPDEDDFVNPDGVTLQGQTNVINKTPADLAAETPEESARRYGISSDIPDDVHNNPNMKATQDNKNYQIPGGTHLHPDVARDNYNRSLDPNNQAASVTTSNVQHVYATEAEVDDKGRKDAVQDSAN